MKKKKIQEVELEISDMAFGGKGIAKVDGFTIFADQTVPLDRVIARIVKKKKNYAEARVTEFLSLSPHRIKPPCPYSGWCGGCKWQFLKYEQQLVYKRQHVSDALVHIGLMPDIPVHPVIASEKIFGYRNKMEFSCSDRRWVLPEEFNREDTEFSFALGLHVPGTFHKVLDISACLLQAETGNAILEDVRQYIKNSGIPVYGLKTHQGFWRFLMLRHSVSFDQWMVNIITASEDRKTVQPLADFLKEKYPNIVSVVNNVTARKAGIAVGEYEIVLAGSRVIKDQIAGYTFDISANSFFQTNTRGAEKLYETVKSYAELSGKEKVWDLYCGTGTIAICLSDKAAEIVGIEIVESAVADARANCRSNGISNCRFIPGDIRETMNAIGTKPDVLILDPPRSGIHKDAVRQIRDAAPGRIVYVSCNPATQARDLLMLKEDYHVIEVQPVDMFPHTFHIECVAKLERKRGI